MHVDPLLLALRENTKLQRQSHTEMASAKEKFQTQAETQALLHELERYGCGDALTTCPQLAQMFGGRTDGVASAHVLANAFVADIGSAIRRAPLGQVPFRHQYSEGSAILQLAEAGRAYLSLVLLEKDALDQKQQAQSICFADVERHELVLAGQATGRLVRLESIKGGHASLAITDAEFRPGICFNTDGATLHETREGESRKDGSCEARTFDIIAQSLVSLRLARIPVSASPTREFRLSDGALIHQASGDQRASRQEMAMAALGAMGRADAAPVMAEMACEAGPDHLRWQALRECLALDSGKGFVALGELAARERDGLAAPAQAMRAQLLDTYPALAQIEDEPCPA